MVKNKGNIFSIISIILLLISSCSNVGTSTSSNIEPAKTIEPPTNIPVYTPTLISTPISPSATSLTPENILKIQPFKIISGLPADVKAGGGLVILNDALQILRFEPQVHVETIPGIDPNSAGCLATSPDGKWLSYCLFSDQSPTGEWLFVKSADWQQQKRVPMDIHLIFFYSYGWLDNERMIFPLIQQEHDPAYPMVVINPFTKEQTKLDSNYPSLQRSPAGPEGHMDLYYGDVVYDPSLNLVIFPSVIEDSYIVLWDRQSKSVLAKIKRPVGYRPLWSPDAKQFVITLQSPKESEHDIIEEWFSISRDGQVEQLTHFGDYFSSVAIGPEYNWSPDSKKLAFWLQTIPSECQDSSTTTFLAVLELTTQQIINTCIPGSPNVEDPLPIWSLNSSYLAVRNRDTSKLFLVDLEGKQAYDITDITGVSIPIGWMVSP